MMAHLTSQTIIYTAYGAQKIVHVIVVIAPTRTVWCFAMEGIVSSVVLCLCYRLRQVLLIYFRFDELNVVIVFQFHLLIISNKCFSLNPKAHYASKLTSNSPPLSRVLEASIHTYTRCPCKDTLPQPLRNILLYQLCKACEENNDEIISGGRGEKILINYFIILY